MYSYNTRTQVSKQSQLVDQNFANNILFKNMSVLQSLQQKIKNQRGPKFFGGYDEIDYSGRSKQVLKEQLRLGLYQVEFSFSEFNNDYNNGYTLPKSYGMQQVLQKLQQLCTFFRSRGEQDCYKMTLDLYNILTNNNCHRFYTGAKFESEGPKKMSDKAYNMVKASKITHDQQQKMEELYKKYPNLKMEDLPTKFNNRQTPQIQPNNQIGQQKQRNYNNLNPNQHINQDRRNNTNQFQYGQQNQYTNNQQQNINQDRRNNTNQFQYEHGNKYQYQYQNQNQNQFTTTNKQKRDQQIIKDEIRSVTAPKRQQKYSSSQSQYLKYRAPYNKTGSTINSTYSSQYYNNYRDPLARSHIVARKH